MTERPLKSHCWGEYKYAKRQYRIYVSCRQMETVCVGVLGARFPKACSLLMDSEVNFGCTAANSQVIIRHHAITNEGSLPGIRKQCSYIYFLITNGFFFVKVVKVGALSLLEIGEQSLFLTILPQVVYCSDSVLSLHMYICVCSSLQDIFMCNIAEIHLSLSHPVVELFFLAAPRG